MIGATGMGTSFPISSIFLSNIITDMSQPSNLDYAAKYFATATVILGVFQCVMAMITLPATRVLSEDVLLRLRVDSFRSIMRQNMAFFDAPENSIGALTARLSSDAALVSSIANTVPAAVCSLCAIGCLRCECADHACAGNARCRADAQLLLSTTARCRLSGHRALHGAGRQDPAAPGAGIRQGRQEQPRGRRSSRQRIDHEHSHWCVPLFSLLCS